MKPVLSLMLALVLVVTQVACTVDQVLSDINLLLQTAASIATAVGALSPADATAIQVVVNTATTGLNVIQKDYDAYKASGATTDLEKLQAAIAALKNNLPAELAAAHVTNPNAVAKATAWVNLVTSTLDTILAVLPKLSANKNATFAELPTPSDLQKRWSTEVCGGDAKCSALVKAHNVKR